MPFFFGGGGGVSGVGIGMGVMSNTGNLKFHISIGVKAVLFFLKSLVLFEEIYAHNIFGICVFGLWQHDRFL